MTGSTPHDTATSAPAASGYSFVGATPHFRIYTSNSFPSAPTARGLALQWLGVIEQDLTLLSGWFGDMDYLSGSVGMFLDVSTGGSSAYWMPKQAFETHISIPVDSSAAGSLASVRSLFAAEVAEQFMAMQNRGWFHPDTGLEGTNGEALSLVCSRELAKILGADEVAAERRGFDLAWLNSATRPDWVNTSLDQYDSSSWDAVGCDILFIYYLMYELGYSIRSVIAAAASTLRGVHRNLSNDPNDPFPAFAALINTRYPIGQKVASLPGEVFPISMARATFPGDEAVPVPDATVAGFVDGLTINGASSTFTSSTELTPFAGGDVAVPPVTSGSPIGALDLCWQLAGNNRVTYFLPSDLTGTYWSLQGHEAGIDYKTQKLVKGRDESVYRLFHESVDAQGIPTGAVYRCWRVRDSYTSLGWAAYDDAIYSTAGQGPSPSITPQTRTHIIATARPGSAAVRFDFGTGFSDLGFGPNGEREGYGKYFSISISTSELSITGGYRKAGSLGPVTGLSSRISTQPLGLTANRSVQILISLEWTDSGTFTIQATAANSDFDVVTATLTMTGTGIDVYAAPWKHTGPIRGLWVQTVKKRDDPIDGMVGPYETTLPIRTTLPQWGLDPSTPFLGTTTSLWDYLTQIAVAKQVDIRNDSGTIVVTNMLDVAFMSHLWSPVATPSLSYGLDNTSKFVEVVHNVAKWNPSPVTLYDTRTSTETFTVAPGTSAEFSLDVSASASLYYTPAPVGGDSSITDAQMDAFTAASKSNLDVNSPQYRDAVDPVILASQNDAYRDVLEWRSESAHLWGAYMISGTFAGINNHSMPAKEWIAYGGSLQITPNDDGKSITVAFNAPAIPGWTGDYTLGISDSVTTHPTLRLAGTGITYYERTLRYATGANPKSTNTEVGSTVTNIAATSRAAVNNLATRAVSDAAGPSIQLTAAIPMSDIRSWGVSLGQVPGSTLLYRNMQWRVLSATISNASVNVTAVPFTTYQSAYWHYNWDGLKHSDFLDYFATARWDDYKVAPLGGAIADWDNQGATVKHTLFPSPDPDDPSVPLEPADDLLPSRLLLPYAGSATFSTTPFPGTDIFPT
jgi:hypothetical protein